MNRQILIAAFFMIKIKDNDNSKYREFIQQMSLINSKQPQQNLIKRQSGNFQLHNLRKELSSLNSPKQPSKTNNLDIQTQILSNYDQIVGNPQHKYLARKFQRCINNMENISRRPSLNQGKYSKRLSLRSHTSDDQRSNQQSIRNYIQSSHEKARMLNQSQKIQRLIAKRQQQMQKYKCLSDEIKIKLSPKKIKISEINCLKLNDITWYKKWNDDECKQKFRKQAKMVKRLKSFATQRFHTQSIVNSFKICESMQF